MADLWLRHSPRKRTSLRRGGLKRQQAPDTMVLSRMMGMAEGGAGKKARASSPSRICGQDKAGSPWASSPALLPPPPGPPGRSSPQSDHGYPPTHREDGPSGDQSVDERGRRSAGSLRARVGLGIGTIVAEEALGVHREGVRELEAVSQQDHDAQQHRLPPSQIREREEERASGPRWGHGERHTVKERGGDNGERDQN